MIVTAVPLKPNLCTNHEGKQDRKYTVSESPADGVSHAQASVDPQEIDGENAATTRGAIEGALIGSAIVAPTWYTLNRKWPTFRSLPYTIKTLGAVIFIAPLISIRAEHSGLEYHRQHHWCVGCFDFGFQA